MIGQHVSLLKTKKAGTLHDPNGEEQRVHRSTNTQYTQHGEERHLGWMMYRMISRTSQTAVRSID